MTRSDSRQSKVGDARQRLMGEGQHWGSPLDRAGEAIAMHHTRLETGGMGRIAWRQVSPDVREAYIDQARVVLRASGFDVALERADEVVRLAREVMHGRAHTGQLLLAIKAYEETHDA